MKRPYQQNYFLPDFCGVRMVFVVVLIAELLAIMITLASPVYLSDFTSDLALNSLFIQWIALTSVAILCICQPFFKTLGNNWVATLSYFLVLLVTFIVTEITWWLMNQWPEITGSPSLSHYAFLLRCMGISSIISALALRYLYVQFQWSRV
jgi:two-component system sensor histidine kinase AlgZ